MFSYGLVVSLSESLTSFPTIKFQLPSVSQEAAGFTKYLWQKCCVSLFEVGSLEARFFFFKLALLGTPISL